MAIRVGINGFGRIGRQVVRSAKEQGIIRRAFAPEELFATSTRALVG